ncbi:MAG: SUMF1/EgtB/PvdO family nonheme iron enzyme [Chloroflexi bacterium]|nr:SUMF1/EgtB/PvdO family nonheme iron enzyme [Chloroflexota bacterium]
MTHKPKTGDIRAARDVIMGDQINRADLTRVETLLDQIVALLRQPQAAVRVERDANRPIIVVDPGSDAPVRFAPADLTALGAIQREAAPRRREEIYLARFILSQTYARWDRDYLPLAGRLLDTPLRLSDRGDQALSSAGVRIDDVRQALTGFAKTRLVILGEPGAGKTTTLHRLALDLARERLRDPLRGKLPFRADLFKFTAPDLHPSDFLHNEWRTTGLKETYGEAVAGGQVCFLLDGVNQMPLSGRAARIERWAHWANHDLPPGNWAIFTCRVADYVTDLRLPEIHVQSLDRGRMEQYFELRFGPERAAGLWRDFEKWLHAGEDERLARNPFTLSLLADRCEEGRAFTGSRAQLMDDLADRLIDRELREGRQPGALTADPRSTLQAAMAALGRFAFAMQARGEGTSLTREGAAKIKLGDGGQVRLALDEVLDLALDATVLEKSADEGQTAIYAFYHHLLQEYFAARELLYRFRAGQRLARHWRVPWQRWQFALRQGLPKKLRPGERVPPPPVTGWEETVIMTAGLAGKDAARFIAAVRRHNLPLAGRCLAEAGAVRPDLETLAGEIRRDLLARQRGERAHLRARIAAGLALGEAGHPDLRPQPFEFEGHTVWAILPPLQAVPAGPFIRGSNRDDPDAYSSEYTDERTVTLPEYCIGRYPVTNAEYALFIEAGGYRDERWWSEEGLLWKAGGPDAHAGAMADWLDYREWLQKRDMDDLAKQRSWRPQELRFWQEIVALSDEEAQERAQQIFERPFDRPAYWDDRDLSSPARPVVGVNWYEAPAYCAWLSAITAREFRLPAESEWEKAARDGDGRKYPWGETFDPARCNTVEGHIYTTTPVGLYPDGVSPHGLFDAAGNVWEWTGDWYQMYPGGEPRDEFGERFRAVRGGSFNSYRWYARCAVRNRYVPDFYNYDIGFRVVSPGSISEC